MKHLLFTKKLLPFAGVFLLLLLCTACPQNDDPGCFTSDVTFTNLETLYDCENTKNTMSIDLQDTFISIDNQADFDTLVTGDCLPEIDFDTYTLIIGKQALSNGNTSISYEYTFDCETGVYNLIVTFIQNETTEAPNLTYHILSPKVEEDETVEVTINLN